MSGEGLLLLVLAGSAWFWWDSLQKREIALAAARLACERAGVQFLDASVELRKLRLRRDDMQRARFYREFAFEYSTQGDDRQPGWVSLLGRRVVDVTLVEQNVVPFRS
jgi:hypothetical protein